MIGNQPARSYTRLAIAIVIAALVIGASVIGSSYLRMASTVVSTVTATSQVYFTKLADNSSDPFCGTVFQKGLNLVGEPPANSTYNWQERLFSMPSNTTATICVSFDGLIPLNSSNSLNANSFPGEVNAPNVTYISAGFYVNSDGPAPGILDTGASHLLTIGNQTYPVMVYTIRAAPDAKGIFSLSYSHSYQCPPWIPIAVGYTTAEAQEAINESYHIFLYATGCITRGQPNGIIVGVGGNIDVDWVVKVNQALAVI